MKQFDYLSLIFHHLKLIYLPNLIFDYLDFCVCAVALDEDCNKHTCYQIAMNADSKSSLSLQNSFFQSCSVFDLSPLKKFSQQK